ncbi:hypothetical protein [Pelagibacterium limicola]|uniref:hypothetical protein n=1 Tax=Pelagibacterium limicola TaxID=2791022 RepID=UPI0018B00BE2|nr:hypothetical protein [Pelagibacterium limicola]
MGESEHMSGIEGGSGRLTWPVIVFIGPLIGSLTMLIVIMVMSRAFEQPDFWSTIGPVTGVVLGLGYLVGLAPAIVSALVWHFGIARMGSPVGRTLLAIATGALAGSILVWPAVVFAFGSFAPNKNFYFTSGTAGAIALLVSARPWKAP